MRTEDTVLLFQNPAAVIEEVVLRAVKTKVAQRPAGQIYIRQSENTRNRFAVES